jgi:hypothetical protein
LRIIIEVSEQGADWIRRWSKDPEHKECAELCQNSFAEYIKRTGGPIFGPLAIQAGAITDVRIEDEKACLKTR